LPDYDALPGGVNLQEILRLWTYAKALDLTQWGKMRYNLMGTAGHWFSGRVGGDWDLDALTDAVSGSYAFADRIRSILPEAHAMLHDAPKKRLSEGG
jgi:predicted aldo/keto reductase-like oxidoreductase